MIATSPINVRPIKEEDNKWLIDLITNEWASIKVVSRGKVHYVDKLPGFIAKQNEKKVGLITYRVQDDECEIITLNSLFNRIGIGSKLVEEVETFAISKGIKRLWLITTNDNVDALIFYQKIGFRIAAIYSNAIAHSRILKPEIPLKGLYDIPIRDEIMLEKDLQIKN